MEDRTGANAGQYKTAATANTLDFSTIETLIGGNANDTLTFAGIGTVTLTALGTVDGFNATESVYTGTIRNINTVLGGAGSDTLIGLDTAGMFEIDGTNRYINGNTLDFSLVELAKGGAGNDSFLISNSQTINLKGMGGDDKFIFADNATLSGATPAIDGGIGTDTLDYSAYTTTPVIVDMAAGTAMNITGGFNAIETLIGGQSNVIYGTSGNDTIIGGTGNDTLVGRGGDDLYIFNPGWGVDTVIETRGRRQRHNRLHGGRLCHHVQLQRTNYYHHQAAST